MKALILAAGYATRLYPLTKDYPKPLLKIGRNAIIDLIIEKLETISEIDEIIVITNSKFFSLFCKWAGRKKSKKPISVVDDLTKSLSDRRGAVGDVAFAISKKNINDDLLVAGGDNIFDQKLDGFTRFLKRHRKNPLIGAYDIKSLSKAGHYGVIKLDRKKRVLEFQEKPKHPKSTYVAMCLYYFPKETLSLIKQYMRDKKHKHDATGLYINWLKKRTAVYAFVFTGKWYDIGSHKFYNEAKEKFAQDN